jgi:hypothetical protein
MLISLSTNRRLGFGKGSHRSVKKNISYGQIALGVSMQTLPAVIILE